MSRRRIRTGLVAILMPILVWSSGCASDDAAPPATSTDSPADAALTAVSTPSALENADAAEALALLSGLPIKGRAPKTGYERVQFGESWTDDVDVDGGHNGCDTRNDILRRDLTAVVTKDGTRGCKVQSGSHFDEYTGNTNPFVSGQDTSPLVQIDHVVALSNAWQTGAQQLDLPTRTALANDPLNLQAVAGAVNQEKGDGDAATWLPPRKGYRCTYIARQIAVKAKYGLWVTQAEHDAMARVLGNCDSAESAAAPQPETVPTDRGGTYFANCAAARAANAAPLHVGRPGYRAEMDGDGDGVACESN
ncbi:conserved exported hypothetical protein [Rhodococcus sp. RD6.2]|nr:conserved exported hypothetical protein [Rhodococcus sp. RD6.2]